MNLAHGPLSTRAAGPRRLGQPNMMPPSSAVPVVVPDYPACPRALPKERARARYFALGRARRSVQEAGQSRFLNS